MYILVVLSCLFILANSIAVENDEKREVSDTSEDLSKRELLMDVLMEKRTSACYTYYYCGDWVDTDICCGTAKCKRCPLNCDSCWKEWCCTAAFTAKKAALNAALRAYDFGEGVRNVRTRDGNANGANCVFPFLYHGKEYSKCYYSPLGPFCATTSDYDADGLWGRCVIDYTVKTKEDSGNANGANCIFPFKYKLKLYSNCTGSDPWCATTYDYELDGKYGYCDYTADPYACQTDIDGTGKDCTNCVTNGPGRCDNDGCPAGTIFDENDMCIIGAKYSCTFASGDGKGGTEKKIGDQKGQECVKACVDLKKDDDTITGVTMNKDESKLGCWCEYNMNSIGKSDNYQTCYLIDKDFCSESFICKKDKSQPGYNIASLNVGSQGKCADKCCENTECIGYEWSETLYDGDDCWLTKTSWSQVALKHYTGSWSCEKFPVKNGCSFTSGDGTGGAEKKIAHKKGKGCVRACKDLKKDDDAIKGVTIYSDDSKEGCWCEYNMNSIKSNSKYQTCYLT
jgi:hypothetical protein